MAKDGVFRITIGPWDPIQKLLPPHFPVSEDVGVDFEQEVERRLVALGADPQSQFRAEGEMNESRAYYCWVCWNIPPAKQTFKMNIVGSRRR